MQKNSCSLVALNAKYIHSNLAIRYIKNYCKENDFFIHTLEYSINDSIDKILKIIYKGNYNIIGFSCYIWNIDVVLKICRSLKKILAKSILVLGGPEVSYDSIEIMKENSSIDYIISNEGEIPFLKLLDFLENGKINIQSIEGLTYREKGKIIMNKEQRPIKNLDIIPSPYENLYGLKNKIIYYETCRGCPFECQYCLSSIEKGVRYFSLNRVFKDIDFFIENKTKQVKLVDRTFNCNQKRSLKIMDYIIRKQGNTNFHFEISSKLINDDFLSLVKEAPKGIFQFEIGIQTTNTKTLKAIKRKEPFNKIKDNIKKLQSIGLNHIHLDLIAGLPYENFNSFEESFNQAYSLQPDMLQLGFLKLLKGSGLRRDAHKYMIEYHEHPPYEVISTKELSYNDIIILKGIEDLLEKYYNSNRFKKSLTFIVEKYFTSSFKLYLSLFEYFVEKEIVDKSLKQADLYTIFYNFVKETFGITKEFNELLKYDYFINVGSPILKCVKRYDHSSIKNRINTFIKNENNVEIYLPQIKSMTYRERLKHLTFEVFFIDVLNDYKKRDVIILFLNSRKSNFGDKVLSFPLEEFIKLSDS